MFNTIITNEWTREELKKPPKNRLVLCHLDDDTFAVCRYNGMYWVGQHGMRLMDVHKVTHWYKFEKFHDDDDE